MIILTSEAEPYAVLKYINSKCVNSSRNVFPALLLVIQIGSEWRCRNLTKPIKNRVLVMCAKPLCITFLPACLFMFLKVAVVATPNKRQQAVTEEKRKKGVICAGGGVGGKVFRSPGSCQSLIK